MPRKPHSIGWSLDPDGSGYTVATYYDGGDRDIYQTGNHPDVSEVWLDPDDPGALSRETLAKIAEQTAMETAKELGVPASVVYHDTDEEKAY